MILHCNECGKAVSTKVPESTVLRAVTICPECIEKRPVDQEFPRTTGRGMLRENISCVWSEGEGFDIRLENGCGIRMSEGQAREFVDFYQVSTRPMDIEKAKASLEKVVKNEAE